MLILRINFIGISIKSPMTQATMNANDYTVAIRINFCLSIPVLTDAVAASVKDIQRFPEANGHSGGLDENRQVSADVIHDEQKNADGGRSQIQRNDLHHDGEHYSEPHFGCEQNQRDCRIQRRAYISVHHRTFELDLELIIPYT